MGGGSGKLKEQIEQTRLHGDNLQKNVKQLQDKFQSAQHRHAEIEREHQDAERYHLERLQEPARQFEEEHQQHLNELQVEKRNAQRLVSALSTWQSDSQQLVASTQPRRPQLLLEVWITGCRCLETDRTGSCTVCGSTPMTQECGTWMFAPNGSSSQPRAGPRLLGEQWVPYEAARATGKAGDHWEIPLAHRVFLGRNACGKPAIWPPPKYSPGAEPDSSASSWQVKMRTTHKSTPTPWRKHETPSEFFEFELLSLTTAYSDIVADVSASGKKSNLKISAQVWRWGGAGTVVSETAELGSQQDESGSPGNSRCSPWLKGDPWTLLFKTPPTNLSPEVGDSGASSSACSYTARFQQDQTFTLALLLSPSLGGGTGILDPWDHNGDPQLLALSGMTKYKSDSCKRLTLRLKAMQGITEPEHELQQRQLLEVQTVESEQEKMMAEVEHMRFEYFEACELATELKSKMPSCGPRDWPAAQKYAAPMVSPAPSGSGHLVKALGGSNLLMSDDVVQVFGACEHAVPDFQMRPRAQVELSFLAKNTSQQFDSVAIKFRNLQPSTLQIAEVEAGRIHEDRLRAMVTRQLNIVLLGVFQDPPVVEVACTLCSMHKQQSRKIDHQLEFSLPIRITNFLNSLPVSRIQDAWGLASCSAKWQVPEETQQELAKASLRDIDTAASCGGALSQRLHAGGAPVFLAELPLGNIVVIVILSMGVGSTADPNNGNTVVDVVVRSEEECLAKSVLEVAKYHLLELARRSKTSKTPPLTHL